MHLIKQLPTTTKKKSDEIIQNSDILMDFVSFSVIKLTNPNPLISRTSRLLASRPKGPRYLHRLTAQMIDHIHSCRNSLQYVYRYHVYIYIYTLSHIRLKSKQPRLRCETGHQASRFLRARYPLTTTNKKKGSGDQPGNET